MFFIKGRNMMKKEMILLKYEDCWADEFDVSSWQIVKADTWNSLKYNFLKKFKDKEFSFCFGTNEEMFYSWGIEFINKIDIQILTSDEVKMIKKIFKCTQMGQFDFIDIIEYAIDSAEESDEESEEE